MQGLGRCSTALPNGREVAGKLSVPVRGKRIAGLSLGRFGTLLFGSLESKNPQLASVLAHD